MAISWTKEYDGAAEPDSGGDYDWVLTGVDHASSDGDILTINTIGQGTVRNYYRQIPNVDFNAGITVEVKAKIIATENSYAFTINMYDGTQDEYAEFRIYDNKIRIAGIDYVTTTTNWHTYRITISGTTVKVYVNGILRITGTVGSATVSDTLSFGDVSNVNGNNINIQIDYLNYKLGEAITPPAFSNFSLFM